MVEIDLLEFLRSGQFGPVHIGTTRTELTALFGAPDQVSDMGRHERKPAILKYGDFEFHFRRSDDRIWLIHCDNFTDAAPTSPDNLQTDLPFHKLANTPSGGSRLQIDSWIVRAGLPRSDFEQAASHVGLSVTPAPAPDPQCVWLSVGADVKLIFMEVDEIGNPPLGLCAISKS